MSINGNNFAFPTPQTEFNQDANGLTKREYFAAMAMQGWLANKERPQHFLPADDMRYCVTIADELLKALAK
jgi:hypothetical protein